MEGEGKETARFRTKPMRVVVYTNNGSGPFIRYGTWRTNAPGGKTSLAGKGTIVRQGRITHGIEPGWCFAGGPTVRDEGAPYDCRSTPWEPDVQLRWENGRLEVSAGEIFVPLDGARFKSCPTFRPRPLGQEEFVDLSQRYPLRDVFDRTQNLVEVRADRTYTGEVGRHPAFGAGSTKVTWRVRLRRAGS
jgi:hypothetical protein